jgi:hypothetical protein
MSIVFSKAKTPTILKLHLYSHAFYVSVTHTCLQVVMPSYYFQKLYPSLVFVLLAFVLSLGPLQSCFFASNASSCMHTLAQYQSATCGAPHWEGKNFESEMLLTASYRLCGNLEF